MNNQEAKREYKQQLPVGYRVLQDGTKEPIPEGFRTFKARKKFEVAVIMQ